MTTPKYVPINFTYVVHEHGDKLGKFLAFMSLTPQFALFAALSLMLFASGMAQHCGARTFFIVASTFFFNLVLKKTIREARPHHPHGVHDPLDFGMPSSHAQFTAAVVLSTYLSLLQNGAQLKAIAKGLLLLIGTALVVIVAVSRVYTLYHTVEQVCVGATVGVVYTLVMHFSGFADVVAQKVLVAGVNALRRACVVRSNIPRKQS
eukprot:PhM_4_TR3281/c0_g1_i1/m.33691/K07252/E3.6.1.43; dolichyldiphosphatase